MKITRKKFYDLWNRWEIRRKRENWYERYNNGHGYPDTDWQELQREANELGISEKEIKANRTVEVVDF